MFISCPSPRHDSIDSFVVWTLSTLSLRVGIRRKYSACSVQSTPLLFDLPASFSSFKYRTRTVTCRICTYTLPRLSRRPSTATYLQHQHGSLSSARDKRRGNPCFKAGYHGLKHIDLYTYQHAVDILAAQAIDMCDYIQVGHDWKNSITSRGKLMRLVEGISLWTLPLDRGTLVLAVPQDGDAMPCQRRPL